MGGCGKIGKCSHQTKRKMVKILWKPYVYYDVFAYTYASIFCKNISNVAINAWAIGFAYTVKRRRERIKMKNERSNSNGTHHQCSTIKKNEKKVNTNG